MRSWPMEFRCAEDIVAFVESCVNEVSVLSDDARLALLDVRKRLHSQDLSGPAEPVWGSIEAAIKRASSDESDLRELGCAASLYRHGLGERQLAHDQKRDVHTGTVLNRVSSDVVFQLSRWGVLERFGQRLMARDAEQRIGLDTGYVVIETPAAAQAASRTTLMGELCLYEIGDADSAGVERGMCVVFGHGADRHIRYLLSTDRFHFVYKDPASYSVMRRDRIADAAYRHLLAALTDDLILYSQLAAPAPDEHLSASFG